MPTITAVIPQNLFSPYAQLLGSTLLQVLYLDVLETPEESLPSGVPDFHTNRPEIHQVGSCIHLITNRGLMEFTTAGRCGEYGMQIRLSGLRCSFHESAFSWPAGEDKFWRPYIGLMLTDIEPLGENGEGYPQTLVLHWSDGKKSYFSAAKFADPEETTVELAYNHILITHSEIWATHFAFNQIPPV